MPSDFVTIATSNFDAEAQAMALLLRQEKINAVIADANAVLANWFWAPAIGYIKVQVPRAQVAAAMEVLRKHPRRRGDDGENKCLACGAPMPEDADHCSVCGWTFKLGADIDEPDALPGPRRWVYTAPYESDIAVALDKLKQRVFESGEFNAGAGEPKTPAEAVALAGDEGTQSILDVENVTDEPTDGSVSPLKHGELTGYFGTEKPTRDEVKASDDFRRDLERGPARYVVLYEGEQPREILFAGCSPE